MYNKTTTRVTSKRLSVIVIFFSLLLLLTVSLKKVTAFEDEAEEEEQDTDFDQDIEDLIAIDEKDSDFAHSDDTQMRFSDAELVSKAQRFVVELNNDNFKKFIDDNEFALILGYAPWCPRSAELMPQFAEASALLKAMGSGVFMAKVDADRFTKAASALDINGFPTLLLFVNGTSHVYTGGFTAEEIVIWTRKKTGVPVIRLSSAKEAEELLKKYSTFVVGLFDKFEGQDYKEFRKAATADNDVQFVEVNDIKVAKLLFPDIKPAKSYMVLIKSQPERYTGFEGPFEAEKILQFLAYNKFPLVTQLTEINSAKVYSSPVTLQLFVFAKADDFKTLLEPLQDAARKFKDKIMFVYVDIQEENLAKPFLTLYGLEDSESTVVTAFDNKISSKYLLESDLTPSNIEGFCSGVLDGTLSSYFKSQPIPENNGSLVQTIVGKTFDDLVLKNTKDIILEVHTPWCTNCETTSKQIEKLAKHFKGLDDLVFAKIDASANEHPKLQVDDYPTLLLYPASDKANPIKLSTKSSSKELAAFINKYLKSSNQSTKDEL